MARHAKLVFVCLLSFVSALSPITKFTWTPSASAPVSVSGRDNTECKAQTLFTSAIEGLALAVDKQQNNCWTDAQYSNGDFTVQVGTVGAYSGWSVSGPATKATKFAASSNTIWLKFSTAATKNVYVFDGKKFALRGTLTTVANEYVKTNLVADKAQIIVAVDAGVVVSEWPQLAGGIEAGIVFENANFKIEGYRYDLSANGQPFDPMNQTANLAFSTGPASGSYRYGTYKRFFSVTNGNIEGVVWQDATTYKVFVTWFAADLLSTTTTVLPFPGAKPVLEAAAGDGKGSIAYMLVGQNNAGDSVTPNYCTGIKTNHAGVQQSVVNYDTSSATSGLNIYSIFSSGASMAWNPATNEIGVLISRQMNKGSDGLNHQGCIALVISGVDMTLTKNLGQTSGHSWSNTLKVGGNGKFIGADLGDNYPRGINLQEFDKSTKQSKVVYTFKTQHCSSAPCYGISAEYTEISDATKKYYKQSNDNEVYTELAHSGAVEVDDNALLVLFSGERPPLDNSKVGNSLNTPRNLGFVKVTRAMNNKTVLSGSEVENGGFYNFGGGWSPQQNIGINWLTFFDNVEENVSRLKAIALAQEILVIFEKWTGSSYVSSHAMTMDTNGKPTRGLVTIDYDLLIPFSDEIFSIGGGTTALMYTGTRYGKLVRYAVSLKVPGGGDGSGGVQKPASSDCYKARMSLLSLIVAVCFAFIAKSTIFLF